MWLGPGHILLVKSTRFAEAYQRFALADIEAITVTERIDGAPFQALAALAAIAWSLIALAVTSVFAKGFFLGTGVLAVVLVVVDVARGSRCRCYLHTAVSKELLRPVSRERTARAFVARLRQEVEAVQGVLPAERSAALRESGATAAPRVPDIVSTPGLVPEILFGLLLVDAALVMLDVRFPQPELINFLGTAFLAEVILAVVALVRRGTRDPRRIAYAAIVVGMVCMGGDVAGLVRSVGGWFAQMADLNAQGKQALPVFTWAIPRGPALFATGWRAAVGAGGLVASYLERQKSLKQGIRQ